MMDPKLCFWCHAANLEPLESIDCEGDHAVVHPSHRRQLENYCGETAAAKWRFLGGIGASILLGFVGALLLILPSDVFGAVTIGVSTAACGVTLLKYPYATPETLALFGVSRSITMVRSAGYFILALAVAVAAYGVTL